MYPEGRERESEDPGRLRESQDRDVSPTCDECGQTIGMGAKTLQGVGIACSDACLNRLCLKHEAAMQGPRR